MQIIDKSEDLQSQGVVILLGRNEDFVGRIHLKLIEGQNEERLSVDR